MGPGLRGPDGSGRVPGRPSVDGYTPHVHVLFVCTANICRSPMAAALFARQTENLSDPVEVSSAGISATGDLADRAVPGEVLEVMTPFGIDLRTHRSRVLTQPMVEVADLIIGMGRRHVQESVLLDPPSWPESFMLKELVRRGDEVGPRLTGQGLHSWIDSAHGDRTRQGLAHRSSADEVDDPYGRSLAEYRATARELADLTSRLALLLWPDEGAHHHGGGPPLRPAGRLRAEASGHARPISVDVRPQRPRANMSWWSKAAGSESSLMVAGSSSWMTPRFPSYGSITSRGCGSDRPKW